jgi:hypothetical protein
MPILLQWVLFFIYLGVVAAVSGAIYTVPTA